MLSPAMAKQLAALQPTSSAELQSIVDLAQQSTDPEMLALCASYIEAALRCTDWQPPAAGVTDKQRAFIDFTEQFVSSVSTMTGDQVTRLLDFATADEVYAFVHAIYIADMALRLEIVGGEVLV